MAKIELTAKYKVGDCVTLSDEYFREGFARFGKELKHQSQKKITVLRVHTKQAGEQDSTGAIIPIIYDVKVGSEVESFCENFLTQHS